MRNSCTAARARRRIRALSTLGVSPASSFERSALACAQYLSDTPACGFGASVPRQPGAALFPRFCAAGGGLTVVAGCARSNRTTTPPKALSWLGSMRRMRDFPYLVMGSTAAGGLGCRFRRALAASCARDGYGGGHFFALSGLEHLSGAAHQRVRGVETSTLPSLVTIGRRYRIQSVCDCERSTISERALSSGRRG